MPIDEARLKEIERDLQYWGEHYDDAEDIEASFPGTILELVEDGLAPEPHHRGGGRCLAPSRADCLGAMTESVRVAFIGTRRLLSLPDRLRTSFMALARLVARHHGLLVTGAALGADQAAAETALRAGGFVHLVLPWASYEDRSVRRMQSEFPGYVDTEVYTPSRHQAWTDSVRAYHPAPDRLTRGGLALHARNYGIVAGAAAVVAAAHDPDGGGGTGQGMRVARGLGIPVFDLWRSSDPEPALLALLR